MGTILASIGNDKQQTDYSCWACCARTMLKIYGYTKKTFADDAALASEVGLSTSQCQDMMKVLNHFNMYSETDTNPFPSFSDIKKDIGRSRPIVICTTQTDQSRAKNVTQGHYVLVVGYDDGASRVSRRRAVSVPATKKSIYVYDPADGTSFWQDYDNKICKTSPTKLYWAMVYYTKPPV
jgi:hypothetical protein